MHFPAHLPKDNEDYNNLLIVVDEASRYPFLIPAKSQASAEIIRALEWFVLPMTGCSAKLYSDNAPAFTSKELEDLCTCMGIQKFEGTIYHPQTTGKAESLVSSVKE